MAEVKFTEIGRVAASETTSVVVSEVTKGKTVIGLNINKHVLSSKFQGFTKGVFIPVECLDEFKRIIGVKE